MPSWASRAERGREGRARIAGRRRCCRRRSRGSAASPRSRCSARCSGSGWSRGLSSGRALLWVLVAVAARAPPCCGPTGRGAARPALTIAVDRRSALLAALRGLGHRRSGCSSRAAWTSWAPASRTAPRRSRSVQMPYAGADPWPSAHAAAARRAAVRARRRCSRSGRDQRTRRGHRRGRGYPFLALALLLVLVAAPVVSLGGTQPVALGVVLAALTVCFLWLERLPLRPGARDRGAARARARRRAAARLGGRRRGAVVRLQVVRRGVRPRRAAALRLEPQLRADRRGRATAPRCCASRRTRPSYWKVRNLDEFDGAAVASTAATGSAAADPELDLPDGLAGPGRLARDAARDRCGGCRRAT